MSTMVIMIMRGIYLSEDEFEDIYSDEGELNENYTEDERNNLIHCLNEWDSSEGYMLGCVLGYIGESDYCTIERYLNKKGDKVDVENFQRRLKEYNITKEPQLCVVTQTI